MVNLSVNDGRLHLDVEGWDKLWAFKSHLDIPLDHVESARVDTEAARGWWHGLRVGGTQLPGVITAGTFYPGVLHHGEAVFYDVHDPDRTIVIELNHERYKRLVVEVEEPLVAVNMIGAALARHRRS